MKFPTCEETEPLLAALADGELSLTDRAPLEGHLVTCPSCQEVHVQYRAIGDLLRKHFAFRAQSEVTFGVIHELEGEVTEAILKPPPLSEGASSIEEIQQRIKALRGPNAVVPNERAEAVTNVGAARPLSQSSPDASGSRFLIGQVLGGYRVDGEIAKGGMGVVYRATQLSMDRPVALKVLSNRLAQDDTFKKRFIREAKAAVTIDHPGIIKVYDAGEDKGETFFAMEYVPGDDAETFILKNGPIDPNRSARIALEVARSLEAAHRMGFIHRDVKPANVLLTQGGSVKLADLGLAKQYEGEGTTDGHLTVRRTVMGSPNYMPPEQARDARETDARSDIYSLGATLYHIVTGTRPWGGGSSVEIMARVMDPNPLKVPEVASNQKPIDLGMRSIVERACAKDPAQRYQTITDFRSDLEAYLKGEPLSALQTPKRSARAPRASTTGNLPSIPPAQRRRDSARRERPASESARGRLPSDQMRRVSDTPSGRRAVAGPGSPPVLIAVVGLLLVAGVAVAIAIKRSGPDVVVDPPEESPRARPTPSTASSISSPPSPRATPSATEDTRVYDELVRECDRLAKLDKPGACVALLESYAAAHPNTGTAQKASREAQELRTRIAKRLNDTLASVEVKVAKNDFEGAEDELGTVDAWGDDVARAKALDAIASVRQRAAKAVPGPSPGGPPDANPSPQATSTPEVPNVQPGSPLTPDEVMGVGALLKGRVDALPGGRVRLTYDFQSAAQADDWTPAPMEPAWIREAFEPLPSTPVPPPYDQQSAWSAARGALLGTGWRRRRSAAVFAAEPIRVDIQAKLLSGKNLVVTVGDPQKPFVVGLALALADAPFPKPQGRTKEEQQALAQIQKGWHELAKPSLVVARERGPFDWVITGQVVAFTPSPKGTHLVLELVREEEGDSLIVGCDSHRQKVALGKGALAAGPIGLEVLGRPVAIETVSVIGALDPGWGRNALRKR